MEDSLFRKESMERISSPEQLDDYLHVTSPSVWMIMTAIILLLVGLLVWGSMAQIDSFAVGTAQVKDGNMVVYFDDATMAAHVETGMTIVVGEERDTVRSIGKTDDGVIFASANTSLADGSYDARAIFSQTQVFELLFN